MRKYLDRIRCLAMAACLGIGLASSVSITAIAEGYDANRPTLGDLMTLTQLRHFKLWYAARLRNWKLAAYELDQFETTIGRIVKLYPSTSTVAQANLIHEKTDPAILDLHRALKDGDSPGFEAAYLRITSACNECHEAAGVGFIVVQVPTKSPFSNQNFKPSR